MNKHLFSYLFVATVGFMAALPIVSVAQAETCTTQYGNGQYGTTTCVPTDLSVDKQVRNPITGVFVENLLSGDATYSPNSEVTYLLRIHNSSNQDFATVQVTDAVPDTMVNPKVDESDQDKVRDVKNPDNRTLVFVLKDTLKAGETREIKVKAMVRDVSVFPKDKSLICDVTNKAQVTAEDRSDEDTASLCVTKDVLGVTTLPSAGPEDYLPLLPFVGMGITGMALIFKRK